jgi:hypothetical protein
VSFIGRFGSSEENSYPMNVDERNFCPGTLLALDFPTMPSLIDRLEGGGTEDLWGNESNAEAKTPSAVYHNSNEHRSWKIIFLI